MQEDRDTSSSPTAGHTYRAIQHMMYVIVNAMVVLMPDVRIENVFKCIMLFDTTILPETNQDTSSHSPPLYGFISVEEEVEYEPSSWTR